MVLVIKDLTISILLYLMFGSGGFCDVLLTVPICVAEGIKSQCIATLLQEHLWVYSIEVEGVLSE